MRNHFVKIADKLKELREMIDKQALHPEQVYYNDKEGVVAILWSDRRRSKATCVEGDKFDLEIGIDIAVSNRLVNNKTRQKLLKNAILQPSKNSDQKPEEFVQIEVNLNQNKRKLTINKENLSKFGTLI